jgi:very-short-patch-repair endonuclease
MPGRSDSAAADAACARLASRQFGVLSRAQALEAGMTETMIWKRISSGIWEAVLPSVYRLGGAPITQLQQLMAAHLYAGPWSIVFGRSAAAAWGISGGSLSPPEVASPRQLKVFGLNIVARHSTSIVAGDVTQLDCLPITNRVRTLIDLSALVDGRTLEIALDEVLRAHPSSLRRLKERMDELRAKRLRGTKLLRRLIEERDPDKAMTESGLETRVRRWLKRFGFPEPEFQYWVKLPQYGPARLDFAYPDKRIGIEADSYAWHSGREAFERDRARNSEFASVGWIILQTTSREIDAHPERPAARLRRAFELRGGI